VTADLLPGTEADASGSTGKPRLKIAIAIHRLSPRGGLEDNCIRISEELRRRGHDLTIFVTGNQPNPSIRTVSLAPEVSFPFASSRIAQFARNFIAETRGQFDRTVSFQPIPGTDILFTADWLRNVPDAPVWRRWTRRFKTYAALEEGCFAEHSKTRIIAVSEQQIRAYVARYRTSRERIVLVPPTLSRDKSRPEHRTSAVREQVRANLGLDRGTPLWLWLGIQPSVKGLDRVLKALEHSPGTHLMVAGLTRDDPKLKGYVPRAVEDRTHWFGYVSGGELMDCIAAADVLAHPARIDVTGGAIVEAIVNGLPVVATSVCGFSSHILSSGAGRVVPDPFDIDLFGAALAEVAGPANAAYSAKGIAYGKAVDLYSGVAVASDLIEAESWPIPTKR
jgi:UDP-glucose:(heptosyl)LPS alpha-1,3-glucosyltransferase